MHDEAVRGASGIIAARTPLPPRSATSRRPQESPGTPPRAVETPPPAAAISASFPDGWAAMADAALNDKVPPGDAHFSVPLAPSRQPASPPDPTAGRSETMHPMLARLAGVPQRLPSAADVCRGPANRVRRASRPIRAEFNQPSRLDPVGTGVPGRSQTTSIAHEGECRLISSASRMSVLPVSEPASLGGSASRRHRQTRQSSEFSATSIGALQACLPETCSGRWSARTPESGGAGPAARALGPLRRARPVAVPRPPRCRAVRRRGRTDARRPPKPGSALASRQARRQVNQPVSRQ